MYIGGGGEGDVSGGIAALFTHHDEKNLHVLKLVLEDGHQSENNGLTHEADQLQTLPSHLRAEGRKM